MDELYQEINNPNYIASYQGIISGTKKIAKDFIQATKEEASDIDEVLALREFRYFIFNVWPAIVSDHISELRRSIDTGRFDINHTLFTGMNLFLIDGDFRNGIKKEESVTSPLYILIKARYYFMPYLLTPRAAARFAIYVGRFLQDYQIGYVYNIYGIEVGKDNDTVLEEIFNGVGNTYLFLGNTIKNAIYATYLEQERFLTYEEQIERIDSKDDFAKEKALLELMATDVLKRRKTLPDNKQ